MKLKVIEQYSIFGDIMINSCRFLVQLDFKKVDNKNAKNIAEILNSSDSLTSLNLSNTKI